MQCHDHATYLVDALIDTNEMIKDWKTMVELLLAKDSCQIFEYNIQTLDKLPFLLSMQIFHFLDYSLSSKEWEKICLRMKEKTLGSGFFPKRITFLYPVSIHFFENLFS